MTYLKVLSGLGQMTGYSTAVAKMQKALVANGYELGPIDGHYGINTHAALMRIVRDRLEPSGLAESTCRSTCNSLWNSYRSSCKACIAAYLEALSNYATPVPDERFTLSDDDIAEVVSAYDTFLTAYIDTYGDGGVDDPRQVARREDMTIEEAAQAVEERVAAREADVAVPETVAVTPVADDVVEAATGTTTTKAGLGWWWLLVIAGVAGVGYYLYKSGQEEEDVMDESSSGTAGCGCGL